jgi:hypothetical protein
LSFWNLPKPNAFSKQGKHYRPFRNLAVDGKPPGLSFGQSFRS